jgi:ACS family allantoate permease-like MFS transporter
MLGTMVSTQSQSQTRSMDSPKTTQGVKDFPQLASLRFLLGLFESALPSAYTLITARFYTQEEQPWRFSLWGLGNTILPVPFILMFYGVGQAPVHHIQPWR